MKIKSYTAESVAEALKRVRSEMGADAFVLKTRRLDNSRGSEKFEMTACTEEEIIVKESAEKKITGESNRVEAFTNDKHAEPKQTTPANQSEQLNEVNKRLDSIDRKLAAIIIQMNGIRQN